ncbi:hypothetical protein [Pajaroellobacter abortibovis]|uniref:Uncharacterized protein n=1 Tax=Pajaroellobacter abortibovis TaxID=1882918 RepID=A0A1L6MXQ8_9BACT|nr:hypothetical protein [Pajaroellobacter abortibovis]APS00381.1 hypothetical protein BCY86_06590 [Pajaroellobacter abortibovis]
MEEHWKKLSNAILLVTVSMLVRQIQDEKEAKEGTPPSMDNSWAYGCREWVPLLLPVELTQGS